MKQRISQLALVVRDYDEAIAFYVGVLGFVLLEDTRLNAEKRWVRVAPPGSDTGLLLARAASPEQASRVGDQTGGRVFLFLDTDDIHRDYQAWKGKGVVFRGEPRTEAYGSVVVFEDLYGNAWDLIQRNIS